MAPSSSPLSTPPTSQPTIQGTKRPPLQRHYRPARPPPFELAQHVQIYFEEGLFTQAFDFLISMVSSGAASLDQSTPTLIPANSHLAIASTLAVHPVLTTRTTSKEKWQQSNAAMRLLRLVNRINGPINSNFYHAFAFKKYDSRSSRNGGRKVSDEQDDSSESDQAINTPYAHTESIWTRAEDFWQVVGWALNCSCLDGMYAARWDFWSVWLEVMLQVLEDDWEIRFEQGTTEESLIWQYVDLSAGGYAKNRRIVRAIFADGSTKSLNEFKEVFRNELKEPTKEADKLKKREVNVNVEEEIYGDYMVNDDDDDFSEDPDIPANTANGTRKSSRNRTPSSRHVTPRTSNSSLRSSHSAKDTDAENSSNSTLTLGSPQSVAIRLRILHLLSQLAGSIPEFFLELSELYTLFVEFIRPLALPIFQQFVSPTVHDAFSPDAHTTLCELVLQRMLESSAPSVNEFNVLDQEKLERDYLPWAASKGDSGSNARVSLLVEALIRRLWFGGKLRRTERLVEALEVGIERRCARVGEGGGRKKRASDEEEAWSWLVGSGERMVSLVRGLP